MAQAEPERDPVIHALELIADGMSLRKACERVGMKRSTLWDRTLDPTYSGHYARARELQAEADAAKIDETATKLLTLADAGPVDNGTVQAYARAIDALKWAAARKHPKVYGDRIEVEQKRDVTVTVVLGAASPNTHTLALPNTTSPNTIEAEVVREERRGPKPKKKAKAERGPKRG